MQMIDLGQELIGLNNDDSKWGRLEGLQQDDEYLRCCFNIKYSASLYFVSLQISKT